MHRLLRIGLIVTLLALTGSWAGGLSGVDAQGTTYTDAMDSEATGLLSSQSPDPARFGYGYQNSQFVIQSLEQGWNGDLLAFAAVPEMADVNVAVDFSIAGDLTGKYAFVGCRGGDDDSAYIFEVHPGNGLVNLWRFDPNDAAKLATMAGSPAINLGSANNRIEITCQGGTITGIANGQQVLTAQDTTYTTGDVFIGTGKTDDTTDLLLTGFDNLSITDLGASAQPAQPTQPAGFPTVIPAQPTQPASFPTAIPAQPTQPAMPTAIPAQPTTATDTSGSTGLTDPRVDPDGTLTDALLVSLLSNPAGGPLRAQDNLTASDFKYLSSGVNLSDLYTYMNYVTPPSTPAGSWSVGFAFWGDGQGNYYDVFIQAKDGAAKWAYGQATAGGYQVLQQGDLAPGAIDFTVGASNTVSLVVANGFAVLSGNDLNVAATIDLGGATGTGDVLAEVGFLAADPNTVETLPVSLSGFRVWDLSPAAVAAVFSSEETPAPVEPTQIPAAPTVALPPTQASVQPTQAPMQPTQAPLQPTTAAAGGNAMLTQVFNQERMAAMMNAPVASLPPGTLQQQTTGFGFAPAGISLANVYVTATFVNPTDLSTNSDAGIGFRDLNNDTEFRFVVRSDGVWALAVGTAAPIVQGTAPNFDATPGASNTLEVIAHGATGLLAVNGVVLQQVDLSANLNAGDVYIASGMYGSDTVEGRQVSYSDFAVYQLPG